MQFVMSNLQTSQPGTYPLVPELRYRPGGYGWGTHSPRHKFNGSVRDSEDAAFVIDLPNGKYQVGFKFQSDMVRPHRIDLYGNGQRLGKPFIIPGEQVPIEKVWPIEVTNERLILVIHSLDRGKNAYWIWSGLTIKRQ